MSVEIMLSFRMDMWGPLRREIYRPVKGLQERGKAITTRVVPRGSVISSCWFCKSCSIVTTTTGLAAGYKFGEHESSWSGDFKR
jgi:hypothetical protein